MNEFFCFTCRHRWLFMKPERELLWLLYHRETGFAHYTKCACNISFGLNVYG